MSKISINKTVSYNGGFDAAIQATTVALQENGFGILTQIDVHSTLKKKLDVEYPRTLILGACNPKLAHRALTANPDVAVLLPCNVVVRETTSGQVEISAMDPAVLTELMDNPEIEAVADEVGVLIENTLNQLSNGS
ncbi:MAG: DUF302 domain-containing protein [Magnetococcales bacterium]|nr:DUF302 domain-containing protein [Magnetococcales bacterium]